MTKSLEQRVYDADRAREVLENEAFQQAFADIQQEIVEQWKNSPARDEEGRKHLWQLLKLSEKLKVTLEGSLEDGKLARLELDHQQSLLDKAKSLVGLS